MYAHKFVRMYVCDSVYVHLSVGEHVCACVRVSECEYVGVGCGMCAISCVCAMSVCMCVRVCRCVRECGMNVCECVCGMCVHVYVFVVHVCVFPHSVLCKEQEVLTTPSNWHP